MTALCLTVCLSVWGIVSQRVVVVVVVVVAAAAAAADDDDECLLVTTMLSTRTWLRYVWVFAIANPSVVCLSVCNVGAPYSGGWNFRQYFFTAVYPATHWHPCKILQRSSRGTPPSGALNARGVANRVILDLWKAISHKRYKIRRWVQLMTNRKWHRRFWGIYWCNFQWPWPIQNPDFKVIGVFCRK